MYLLLYVNDMLIASKNIFKINILKNRLNDESEMKDLGITKYILGIKIYKDRSAINLVKSCSSVLETILLPGNKPFQIDK